MDWELANRLMDEGKLPALAALAARGNAQPLATALPPQSPVAWSDFITGLDAGGHGIFDFIQRDPGTMVQYLSTSATEGPGARLEWGSWQIPLSGGKVKLLRRGTPFWEVLQAAGVPTTIVRIPADFPPTGTAGRELSGMGTPDLLGGYGTFTFYTTRPERLPEDLSGARVVRVAFEDQAFRGRLAGPPNPFRVDGAELSVDLEAYRDTERPVAKIVVDGTDVLLNPGEWSDWIPVSFPAVPVLVGVKGMVRLYLGQVHPDFELYVSPINIDPLDPVMPVSHPADFAAELARTAGRFYTQGMPEDTKAFTSGVLDEEAFLEQSDFITAEQVRQYDYLLERFEGGLLFYYFGFLDQASHVMWHPMDPEHPAHDAERPLHQSRFHRLGHPGTPRAGRDAGRDVRPRVHVLAPGRERQHVAARERLPGGQGSRAPGRRRVLLERRLVPHPGLRPGVQRHLRQPQGARVGRHGAVGPVQASQG
jgi:hypothetical protein